MFSRTIDFEPEFLWNEGEPFPAGLLERARHHSERCHHRDFAGAVSVLISTTACQGVFFVVLGCAECGEEIGRGIVWRTPYSDSAYPWQPGYWARVATVTSS